MATSFLSLVKRFAREERGASMIEYAILIGLITATVVTTIGLIGTDVAARFEAVRQALGIA